MHTAGGVEDVTTAKMWPGEMRRKPEPAADAVQCPPVTH